MLVNLLLLKWGVTKAIITTAETELHALTASDSLVTDSQTDSEPTEETAEGAQETGGDAK